MVCIRGTARDAWLAIEDHFLGNHEIIVLHLDVVFYTFIQSNLSISDYYRKMNGMADVLGDLGEVVPDRTLVLNLLCGLNKRFDHMKTFIRRTTLFPAFQTVRNDLLLEEMTMDDEVSTSASTALRDTSMPAQQQ